MADPREGSDRVGEARGLPRRTFVELAALGASAAIVGCGRGATGSAGDLPALLADLGPGTTIDRWTIVAVHPVMHGAIPIVLEAEDGERFQVDVMAKDPSMPGVGQSRHFSVFVANAGDGHRATDERHGLGAMALAAALREREQSVAPLPELWTMAERSARAPDGTFRVPLG